MFGSVKVKNWRLTVLMLIGFVMLAAVCLMILRSGTPESVEIDGVEVSLCAENGEAVALFCEACGYPVGEPLSDREITVPKHWNEIYQRYNELQKEQGFDLLLYKGKTARELVYAVSDDELFTLLICDNKICAAHLSSADGTEMHGIL